ncbi:MAG: GNAT family N-acetyltransferase [Verrucomicrobiia bacterium]|jgi:L-amino acid N-acyltransferase YncA
MSTYPKKALLRNNIEIVIRPLEKNDAAGLLAFFSALPEEDRLFLKDDVTKEETIARWMEELDYSRVFPLVAIAENKIIGDATLHFSRVGWSKHLAELRCVVARNYQKMGLGTLLMRELVIYAQQKGVEKIVAQMMDTQLGAQKAFERIGFKKEAELKGFVVDLLGKKHNLIIMVNDVSELWKKMEDVLLDYDIKISE